MRDKNSVTPRSRTSSPDPSNPEDNLIPSYMTEDDTGRGTRRAAIVLAVVFHIALLAFSVPEATTEAFEQEPPQVYVVEQVRFKPPVVDPVTPPTPRERRVPVPDPTPDDPEPDLRDIQIEPDYEMPIPDVIYDHIPEGPPEPAVTGPMEISGAVVPPIKIYHPNPAYTEVARRARIEGVVVVEAIVDVEGNVTKAEIIKPLPMGLDDSTLQTVVNWKFEPATLRGKPVPVIYRFSVTFGLN